MIPKIIHYCWFGNTEIPEESKSYITEWQNLHKEWKFILWNEDNSPMHVPYMQLAYEQKMWANLSNFIRLYVLKEYGGIYIDTDVKLIKPLDSLLENNCFLGFEEGEEKSNIFWVNNAICGSEIENIFILECYDFLLKNYDGAEMANLSGPRMTTELLKNKRHLNKYGFQRLSDVTLYPKEFFYPIHYSEIYKLAHFEHYISSETIAVHVWARTWLTKDALLDLIDELYRLNSIQKNIAKLSILPETIKEQNQDELSEYIKQILSYQYFFKSFIEGFSHSTRKLENLLKEKEQKIIFSNNQNQISQDEIKRLSFEIDDLKKNNIFLEKELEKQQDINTSNDDQNNKNLILIERKEIILENYRGQLQEYFLELSKLQREAEIYKQKNYTLESLKQKYLDKIDLFIERDTKMQNWVNELQTIIIDQNDKIFKLFEVLDKSKDEIKSKQKELEVITRTLTESNLEKRRLEKQVTDLNDDNNKIGKELLSSSHSYNSTKIIYEEEILQLLNQVKEQDKAIAWYRSTYQNRSLLGVIKTKLLKGKNTEKKTPSLKQEILNYLKQNKNVPIQNTQKLVSIIILSLNRVDDTLNAVKNIYSYTKVPFEIIILDNNSNTKVKHRIKKLERKHSNLKVILKNQNLGCAGGRNEAKKHAKGEYVLFLDNDILVFPYYLEYLINRVESDERIAAACCKTIFPDGNIQFNGGSLLINDDYALFSLINEGLNFKDQNSNTELECQWIPGGATLWKKEILDKFSIDSEMKGSFEDNEVCFRLINAGYKLVNSPRSIVIHNHFMYKKEEYKKKEDHYNAERNNANRLLYALLYFYKKHKLIISFAWKNNPWDIYFGLHSKEEIIKFINEKLK